MTEPLVDDEGYPRSDIDIYQVRHARHQIKCLQNDHTALLRQIEDGLVSLHSKARTAVEDPNGVNVPPPSPYMEPFAKVDQVTVGSPANVAGLHEGDLITKFGSITLENFRSLSSIGQLVQNSVNSSIQICAGLGISSSMDGNYGQNSNGNLMDIVGHLTFPCNSWLNGEWSRLGGRVVCGAAQPSLQYSLMVSVNRSEQKTTVTLTPRQWSGRGLLGCNIVPIERLDR